VMSQILYCGDIMRILSVMTRDAADESMTTWLDWMTRTEVGCRWARPVQSV
jgi:hypothetical protein